MKRIYKIIVSLLMVAMLIVGYGSNLFDYGQKACGELSGKEYSEEIVQTAQIQESAVQQTDNKKNQNDDLKVTMLDVGQGLSILFESDGHKMLYDGGNRKHSSYVVSYLKKHDITELDYVIASHYDEDHIAGLVGVLKTVTVKDAIIPRYETDTDIYSSFMTAAKNAASVEYAKAGESYTLGNAKIDLLYACKGTESSDNDKSTIIKVSSGDFSAICTGDAETDVEKELVKAGTDLSCTLYVVGHHGSSSSSSGSFVKAMNPEVAYISVGEGNSYGHPTEETLDTLSSNHVQVYRSDEQGEVTLSYADGSYKVTTEKTSSSKTSKKSTKKSKSSVQSQAANSASTTGDSSSGTEYILNTSTMKFHYADCSSVKKMAEHNKEYSTESRDSLIAKGYSPCGNCNP